MAPRNAGPAGSGLLPPGVGDDTEGDEERDDPQGGTEEEEPDLEGVPPVDEEKDDDEGDGEDEEEGDRRESLEAIERRLEDKFQKKFDRAVSKAVRNLERKNGSHRQLENDDDDGEEEPDVKKRKAPARLSDGAGSGGRGSSSVTHIRLLARDVISDEMEESGKQERVAVKKVVDSVVQYVNWDLVDDEAEFVEELVGNLKTVASDLVKTGSDRKVAQLKKAGVLQQRPGQPGSAPAAGNRGQVAKKLENGAAAAGRRFPGGSRSLHGR